MKIRVSLILVALVSAAAFAQAPAKKPVPVQAKTPAVAHVATPEQLAQLPALRTDLDDVRRRIAEAEAEDQKYSWGDYQDSDSIAHCPFTYYRCTHRTTD